MQYISPSYISYSLFKTNRSSKESLWSFYAQFIYFYTYIHAQRIQAILVPSRQGFFFPDLSVNATHLSLHIWKGVASGNRNTLPTNGEQGGSVVIIPPVSFSGSALACIEWIGARPKTNSATVFLEAGGQDSVQFSMFCFVFFMGQSTHWPLFALL